MKFPFFAQIDSMDCGPSCLRIIAKYYGKEFSIQVLREISNINREGVSLYGISEAAEFIGLRSVAVKTTIEKLEQEMALPFIAHWNQNHFIVVYKIKNNNIYVSDPAIGLNKYTKEEFLLRWISSSNEENNLGVVMLLEPTTKFYSFAEVSTKNIGFGLLFKNLTRYKKILIQIIFGILMGSLIQLIFPFLTKSIVDTGIKTKDIKFIYIILLSQLMLYLGQTSIEFMRSWVLLHINTRINVSLLADFLSKLMRLPISFFERKTIGDILQRIGDQERIQSFLTGPALNILFSALNFIIFSVVIVMFNIKIFFIFLSGSIIYVSWVLSFMKYRKKLDYKRFEILSQNQSSLIQIVTSMQEIKMNTCEIQKRWEWERIQGKAFKVSLKTLELSQYQQGGTLFISQITNIFITIFSATAVVNNQITLGTMLAIQYMIGQLNGPIEQFIIFIQSFQNASISMERLNDINKIDDEEPIGISKITKLPEVKNLTLRNVFFRYGRSEEENVIRNIDLFIPFGKTTAIVGLSGSGKTTLLKLLMKFYLPTAGTIELGDINLADIKNKSWRSKCGAVLQDSYIFPDSISRNIAIADEYPDINKLVYVSKIANIMEYIESLPLGFNTKIGTDGSGISQGQKQRILIARALYKNPDYFFFDEATNSLDSINELQILNNLAEYFKGKTVVIVAHRLSTVKHADQIIVLDKGEIIEKGTHDTLIANRKTYFNLVKNQIELDN